MSTRSRAARVGELRPSALVHTFGVGAVVDLPRLSVMVMGLDEWRLDGHAVTIDEPRLVRTLRAEPGLEHLQRLVAPPIVAETGPPSRSALDASRRVGVPVAVFPRWLVCPVCRRLAPIEGGQFDLRTDPFRPERSEFVHRTCQPARGRRPPTALPARFVVACEDGHMDDFPWVAYVHGAAHADEVACAWSLRLEERDPTGEIAGIYVRCEQCEKAKAMAAAFGEAGRQALPPCSGGHPHLRLRGECERRMRAMLLGASNSWFAVTRSALSVLDVFSRYAVGWTVQHRESSQVAKALIAQAAQQQQIRREQLVVHADRGSSMTSKPVAFLLADLGITKSHSRPYTSTDNPYSEAQFKTLKYRPAFPARFDSIEHARGFCREFFDCYNHDHRHSGVGLMTPATVHYGRADTVRAERQRVLDAAYARTRERFVGRAPAAPPVPTAAWINKPTPTEEAAHSRNRREVSHPA